VRLSVLIPTITPRQSVLSRALWYLDQQSGDFEVIVHGDDELGLGDKINAMVAAAGGDYVTVLDDDDHLTLDYMSSVLPACESVDAIGYRFLALKDGRHWLSIEHDPRNEFNGSTRARRGTKVVRRSVCQKIPIRRELAAQVTFGNEYTADFPWSEAIHGMVETSTFIDRHLYVYDWWPETMAFKDGREQRGEWNPQRNLGLWPYRNDLVRWM